MAATIVLNATGTSNYPIFDLSQFAGMTILRARLVPKVKVRTGDGKHATEDVRIVGDTAILPWAGPRYVTIDCTDAVQSGGTLKLDFMGLTSRKEMPTLEVTVAELIGNTALPALSSVTADCSSGQVFLRWFDATDPAVPVLPDVCSPNQFKAALAAIKANPRKVRYRIYKSRSTDIRKAVLVDEIGLLWQWSPDRWGWNGVDTDRRVPKDGENVPRLAIPAGDGLTVTCHPNEAVYVDTPDTTNDYTSDLWYYGVSVAVNGEENLDAIAWSNYVSFVPAVPTYHYQFTKREQSYGGIPDVNVAYYVRWESPKTLTSNMPSEPCWYTVGEPVGRAELAPAMMVFHPWGGMVGDPGQPPQQLPSRKPVILSTGQRCDVYDFYTGYCEAFRTNKSFVGSTWHSYTYNRCRQFIDWAVANYDLDPEQIGVHGGSMGGTGSFMQAVFNPKIACCHTRVGNLEPSVYAVPASLGRTSPGNRVRDLWGSPGELQRQTPCYIDGRYWGTEPYRLCDLVQMARDLTRLPYIVMGFGSNDTQIPPAQHYHMMSALEAGGHTYAASWDDTGHRALSWWPSTGVISSKDSDLVPRLSHSLPAFSGCSLNDPDTSPIGQRNRWLCWGNVVDSEQEWSCDVWLNPTCPADSCYVSVVPARSRHWTDCERKSVTCTKGKTRVKWTRDVTTPDPTPDPIPQLTPAFVLHRLGVARTAMDDCVGRIPSGMIQPISQVGVAIDAAKEACAAWEKGELS